MGNLTLWGLLPRAQPAGADLRPARIHTTRCTLSFPLYHPQLVPGGRVPKDGWASLTREVVPTVSVDWEQLSPRGMHASKQDCGW